MNVDTLSDTTNTDELSFEDLADAVASGDNAALDRLMAGEQLESTTEEEAPSETADEEVAETPQGDEPQESVTGVTTNEAAPVAASSSTTEEDVIPIPKQELHRLKSDAGRTASLQRRMQEMDQELRALKARAATAEASTSGAQSDAAPIPDAIKRRIEALRDIDPELADTLEAMHTNLASEARSAKQAVVAVTQHDQEQAEYNFYMEQKTRLLEAVPQAEQVFATPAWKQWKESQTPGMRALTESGYAEDMVKAIYTFVSDMRQMYGQPATQSQVASEGGDPITNQSPVTQQANNPILENRARKVQVAAEVRSPAAKASVAFDEDTAFKEAYAKALKDMNIK